MTRGTYNKEPRRDNRIPVTVETKALIALKVYESNYDQLFFRSVATSNKPLIIGEEPFKCRFCTGEPPGRTFKNHAHALPGLLGNKLVRTLYECDDCNKRFASFEDDLAKMTLADRNSGVVIGKNGVPTLVSRTGKTRMEWTGTGLHIRQTEEDEAFGIDGENKQFWIEHLTQPYRPLGAYKSLCKSAVALLPQEELEHFPELLSWLLEP